MQNAVDVNHVNRHAERRKRHERELCRKMGKRAERESREGGRTES